MFKKTLKITKQNSGIVPAVVCIPDDPWGLAVVIHGFTSSKESATVKMLLEQFPAAGIGMIAIDLPGHGTHEARGEELRIENCLDSIAAAEEYISEIYPGLPVFYFGSSFGAYLTGLYLSTRPHKGRKAFFRSGAVNMPELFIKEHPTKEEAEMISSLETKGYFDFSMDDHDPVTVTKAFYRDLEENDLFEIFDPDRFGSNSVAMAHGLMDKVIDPAAARRFSEKFNVPVTFFENEGHSLSNDPATPVKVAGLAAAFYKDS